MKLIIEKLKITNGLVPYDKLLDSQLIKLYLGVANLDYLNETHYEIDKKNGKKVLLREKILEEIKEKCEKDCDEIYAESIEDLKNIKIEDIDIVLINSDF